MNAHVFMRSGARVNTVNPRLDTIHARDIAEQLAKHPMHRGATWGFYSVAQHSVLVAQELAREEGPLAALYALLHHAHELFSVPYVSFLERNFAVLHGGFDLDWPPSNQIVTAMRHAHPRVEMSELRQLCTGRDDEVLALEAAGVRPLRGLIKPVAWDKAMERYIEALRLNIVAAQLPLSAMPAIGDVML